MVVDSHVHVWKNDPAFPWARETANPPEKDYTPEMLLELMRAHGVDRTVLVQPIQYRWDNRYVADALRRFPGWFMAVCRVNPEDPMAPDHLSRLVEEDHFHGVRLSPAADASGDWFTGPLMDPLFARAEHLQVPILILTRPPRLADLARLMERHPELDVCIDHMADADPSDPEQVRAVLAMARFPRAFIKISHTWSLSGQRYPWADTHGLVARVRDAFGPERIMWATDWPVCLERASYGQTLAVVRDHMTFLLPDELEWVLGRTALRLWPFGGDAA